MRAMINYVRLAIKYPNYIGYGAIHYFFSSYGQTFLIALFVPYIIESLSIPNARFSLIYAAATLTSAAIMPFIGSWIDKTRARTASLVNAAGIIVFSVAMAAAVDVYFLFLALLGLRFFGQGMMSLIGGASISRYFDSNRGSALSIASLGLPIAEAVLPFALVFLIDYYDWRSTWLILAAVALVVFVPLAVQLIDKKDPFQQVQPPDATTGASNSTSRKGVLKDAKFYLILPSMIFMPLFVTGIFIHQNMLAEYKGWTTEWMALSLAGYGVARIATNLFAGPLIDKFSAKTIYLFHLAPLCLGLILLFGGSHPYYAMIFMTMVGVATSFKALSSTALWAEIYGVHHLGAIKSVSSTLMIFSTAVGPVVVGWGVAESLPLTIILAVASIFVLTGLAFLGIKRSK